jgi:hypothetical protein
VSECSTPGFISFRKKLHSVGFSLALARLGLGLIYYHLAKYIAQMAVLANSQN